MYSFSIYIIAISEAKKATQLDTSSAVPRFPDGILFINELFKFFVNFVSHFSFDKTWRNTQLILIFFLHILIAKLFENATMPAFDAA